MFTFLSSVLQSIICICVFFSSLLWIVCSSPISRFTVSDYPFGIFKLFFVQRSYTILSTPPCTPVHTKTIHGCKEGNKLGRHEIKQLFNDQDAYTPFEKLFPQYKHCRHHRVIVGSYVKGHLQQPISFWRLSIQKTTSKPNLKEGNENWSNGIKGSN